MICHSYVVTIPLTYSYVHVYVNYVHLHAYVYMIKLATLYSVYIHVTTHVSSYVCPCRER